MKVITITLCRVLLVHHDYTGGVFPPSAIGINQDDPAAKLYSILDRVEDFRAADGKFHFSLCYPGMAMTSVKSM